MSETTTSSIDSNIRVLVGATEYMVDQSQADRIRVFVDEVVYGPIKVELTLVGVSANSTIAAIKEVRAATGLSLRDAKNLVDDVRFWTPRSLGRYEYRRAQDVIKAFSDINAQVKVQSPLELLAEAGE